MTGPLLRREPARAATTGALLRRELTLAVRDGGLRWALLAQLAALALAAVPLYLGIAGSEAIDPAAAGVPAARLLAVQWVLACAVAPWALLRLGQPEQEDELVGSIALSGRRPGAVAIARWAAGAAYLGGLLIAGLPAVLFASAVSAARPRTILAASLELFVFLALAGLAAFHWGLAVRPGLAALGLAYLTLLALAAGRLALAAFAGRVTATGAALAAALGLALWLRVRADRRLLYL